MTDAGLLPRTALECFKRDLWKDMRELALRPSGDCAQFVKHYPSDEEARVELLVLRHLARTLRVARVPEVLASGPRHVMLPYFKGMRIFNLFVALDGIAGPLRKNAEILKRDLLARCEVHQREIQASLMGLRETCCRGVYPAAEKVRIVAVVLTQALGLSVDWTAVDRELVWLDERWRQWACVPFRDATTKNMLLADPRLSLARFPGEEARRTFIERCLAADDGRSILNAPIVDFDFSSCIDASTIEDDVISLRHHERTWMGLPTSPAEVAWAGMPDPRRAAMTFLVRYYRLGGRKGAYRLLHPIGHRVRFRHDNDLFYFERLPGIMRRMWPDASEAVPALLALTRAIALALTPGRPEVDGFVSARLAEPRRYYVDVYPH